MSQGGRERGEASGRSASASLNEAVKELRATESSMCQKPGSGPGGKTSSQRLGEIGQRQNQLNRESREMARRLSKQLSMAQGEPAEMRRLADEQRRIREQLEEVRRDEEAKKSLLGRLDDVEKDMQKAEETLRQGEMGDELEQQQTQIMSRLLDAARSIHRRDFDPEREARRGEDVAHPSPAALSSDLFRENDRLRQDLLKADADRVPPRYRSLIEAYLRSLNAASAPPATTTAPPTPPGTPQ
jgi:DNA repair exonuclease SbcCD ATPase subunit